jgi:ATP adenylyltransferase
MELLLNEVYGPHGFNIGLNIGNASGASIRHLHIHLVPRFKNELGAPEIIHKTKVFIEDLNTSYKKIRGKLLERLKKI